MRQKKQHINSSSAASSASTAQKVMFTWRQRQVHCDLVCSCHALYMRKSKFVGAKTAHSSGFVKYWLLFYHSSVQRTPRTIGITPATTQYVVTGTCSYSCVGDAALRQPRQRTQQMPHQQLWKDSICGNKPITTAFSAPKQSISRLRMRIHAFLHGIAESDNATYCDRCYRGRAWSVSMCVCHTRAPC